MESFKEHWKIYIPSWLLPFYMISISVFEEYYAKESWVLNGLMFVWFFVAYIFVAKPYMKNKASFKEVIVFWAIIPFITWSLLVELKLPDYPQLTAIFQACTII